jgi:hypothetical protein
VALMGSEREGSDRRSPESHRPRSNIAPPIHD